MNGLPRLSKGRPTATTKARYDQEVQEFCDLILKIRSRLDFEVGTRGWGYLLEGERVIDKGEFDACERLIRCCRRGGPLPLDICAEDSKRAVDGIERLDWSNIEAEANSIMAYVDRAHLSYTPVSFWEDLDFYVETAVEKSDLKSLFSR